MDPPLRRALIVDDDADVRGTLRGHLEGAGWRVDDASSAAEAEELLARGDYEVIVLDFVLPDADGVQCIRMWRRLGVTSPVLGLTGARADAVLEAFIKAGAHDVLEKSGLERERFLEAVDATGGPPGYPEHALPRPRPLRRRDEEDGEPTPLASGGKLKALVVDDTPLFRVLLRRYLERDGWEVDECASAEEALGRASQPYDLLLLDYLLPDMDGATLLRKLRRLGVHAPALAMTGHATEEVGEDVARAGAAGCLAKEGLTEARLRQAVRGVTTRTQD